MAPNTPQTYQIINEKVLSAMNPTSFLINIARGELVDEDALLDALKTGTIAGAALDAFVKEPLPSDHPFWHHERVRITPHIAAVPCPRAAAEQIAASYRQVLAGQGPLHPVDRRRGY